ncbi:MAG: DUF4256 domain-containing protein [Paludibacteraceae bacterium]
MEKLNKTPLTIEEIEILLCILKKRFTNNMNRHKHMNWSKIQVKLEDNPEKLLVLKLMEETGGEPDVLEYDKTSDTYTFYDCTDETPKGKRRSVCYDPQALKSRKTQKPHQSAVGMAEDMGIELLDEAQYQFLQQLGNFDTKTSSWLKTPPEVRELGGAIFGDKRYGRVFVYHNGAESYYSSRGFRGLVKI